MRWTYRTPTSPQDAYAAAAKILDQRPRRKRREVAPNTWVAWAPDDECAYFRAFGPVSEIPVVCLTYHSTKLVLYCADGRALVDLRGWWSTSTIQRLNRFTPFTFGTHKGYRLVGIAGRQYICPAGAFWIPTERRRRPRLVNGKKLVSWEEQQAVIIRARNASKRCAKRQRQKVTRARQYVQWICDNRLLSRGLHPVLDRLYAAGAADAHAALQAELAELADSRKAVQAVSAELVDARRAVQAELAELAALQVLQQRLQHTALEQKTPGRSRLLELVQGSASVLVPIDIYAQ